MLSDYTPILLILVIAAFLALAMVYLTHIFGPVQDNPKKREIFECGSEPIGTARMRFPVKFYVVAILFILFDVEGIFVVPWAVLFKQLGVVGFVEMAVFLGILVIGLAYVWRKGGLEWE